MNKKRLTVFTPTYNREKELHVLYNSLLGQTSHDFEWLVIDDGSRDGTEMQILKWAKEAPFEIKYYKKPNGGKHTTIDFAHEKCDTDYITICDSDDYFLETGVETILKKIEIIDTNSACAGIVSVMINSVTRDQFIIEQDVLSNYNKLKQLFGCYPETIIVLKTEIAKKYRFPSIPNERFITEGVYYNQIFREYSVLIIAEKFNVYEYIEGGYTKQGMDLFYKNPEGYLYFLKQSAHYAIIDKKSFYEKILYSSMVYAWKNALQLKDNFKSENKIKFPYNLLGRIGQFKLLHKYKVQYKDYLQRQIEKSGN